MTTPPRRPTPGSDPRAAGRTSGVGPAGDPSMPPGALGAVASAPPPPGVSAAPGAGTSIPTSQSAQTGRQPARGARGPARAASRLNPRAAGAGLGRGRGSGQARAGRATPLLLRQLSIAVLVAGGATGLASCLAAATGATGARTSANAAVVATATTNARTSLAEARADAATAQLTGVPARAATIGAQSGSLPRAAEALATASASAPGSTTIHAATQAIPGYAAALARAGTGGVTGPAAALASADQTLTAATTGLEGLSQGQLQSVDTAQTTARVLAIAPLVLGGASTLLLAGAGVWLARRTHRVINPPLLAGTILVAAATVIGAVPAGASVSTVQTAGSAATAVRGTALVRAASAEARAAELQALVPGSSITTDIVEAADGRLDSLLTAQSAASRSAWSAYLTEQRAVTSGMGTDRGAAASRATGSARTVYDAYLATLPEVRVPVVNPSAAPGADSPLPWLALLAGLGGGGLAWVGLDRRLKDYR